mgnify:CR=1 FL=1
MNYPFCVEYFRDESHKTSVSELLLELDSNAAEVDAHFNGLRHMPMGKYFEQLVFFVLDKDPRFELLLTNHQIIEDKTTIGELDVILKDMKTNTIEHWELCLKYYLQSEPSLDQRLMLGPGAKDDMDRKVRKLTNHQMKLSEHPSIKSLLGNKKIEPKLFMKGQLFYHLEEKQVIAQDANPNAEMAWWCYQSEIQSQISGNHKWLVINKPDWIGKKLTQSESQLNGANQTIDLLNKHFSVTNNALMLVGLSKIQSNWREKSRGFVVNNNWPK